MSHPDFSAVRAVYFDLDDTLCAYWDAATNGLRATFEQVRPDGKSVDDMMDAWAVSFRKFCKTIKPSPWYEGYLKSGEPTRVEQMRLTLVELGLDDAAMSQRLSDVYFEERDKALKLFPEALGVVKELYGRFPLGLITNGPADIQNQEIDTLGLRSLFQHILIEGEMGEGKPLQSVFLRAQGLVACAAHEVLFIGNSLGHDMRPAIEAGWRTAWIRRASDVPPSARGETASPEPIPGSGPLPDLIINSLDELLPHLSVATAL